VILFVGLLSGTNELFEILQSAALDSRQQPRTFGWIFDQGTWQLSNWARKQPEVYRGLLHAAINYCHLDGCVGARVGFQVAKLSAMPGVSQSLLIWWRGRDITTHQTLELSARFRINMRTLFEHWDEVCWVEFLCVDAVSLRDIRNMSPFELELGGRPASRHQADSMSDASEAQTISSITGHRSIITGDTSPITGDINSLTGDIDVSSGHDSAMTRLTPSNASSPSPSPSMHPQSPPAEPQLGRGKVRPWSGSSGPMAALKKVPRNQLTQPANLTPSAAGADGTEVPVQETDSEDEGDTLFAQLDSEERHWKIC